MIPTVLVDRYELKAELSRKAGRRTYRAIDRQTDLEVIVKVLLFGPEFKWADLRLFEREIEVLRSLDHPTIPKYLDSFDVEMSKAKGFGLVQENISALSLEQGVQRGRVFSETDIREIGRSLLETLIYLHRMSPPVIHRDIKPSNVLLGDRSGNFVGDVYLVDFGAVQTAVMSDRQTMTVVGTYGYMPPEQFAGRSSPGSDLYSLGATLLYLVTGKHPAEMVSEDLELEFGDIEHVSQHLEDWLTRMVQPIKSKRFGSALEALEALEKRSTPSFSNLAPQPTSRLESRSLDPKTGKLNIVFTPRKLLIERLDLPYRYNHNHKKIWGLFLSIGILLLMEFSYSSLQPIYKLSSLYFPSYSYTYTTSLPWIFIVSIIFLIVSTISLVLSFSLILPVIAVKTYSDKSEIYTIVVKNSMVYLVLIKNELKFHKQILLETISNVEVIQANPDLHLISIVAGNTRYQFSDLEDIDPLWLAESLANWLEVPLHDRS